MSKRIFTVIGARPQFIKSGPVSSAIMSAGWQEFMVHTGQHFDSNMSTVFFEQMKLRQPDVNLKIHSLPHGAMTGRMLEELELHMKEQKPDLVLVYGDTNSTLSAALAAAKLNIPLAHVESGLRSFNEQMPEEINRILTDRISQILFCPTRTAIKNLENEGYQGLGVNKRISLVGDVMYDAALKFADHPKALDSVTSMKPSNDFILCTLHRQENTDYPERLKKIVEEINKIHKQLPIVLPLHPRTKQKLEEYKLSLDCKLIAPQGYLEMLCWLKQCQFVMTDSGGVQKEAYFMSKKCLTLRTETEWIELVEQGVNKIVGNDTLSIADSIPWALKENKELFNKKLYGNGNSSQLIIDEIIHFFG
tara:strand:- start:67 stop:1155 length:1089 start_codon:yes stop_codon:yes gene_type:complete